MRFDFSIDDIKYIKIQFNEESGLRSIKAAIRSINEREITANAKYEEGLQVKAPQEVTLSVVCSDGLYCTRTRLKTLENDEPYMFIALETPEGMEYQQNREYFRVPACFDAIYFPQVDGEIKKIDSKTVDISANGVCVILSEQIVSSKDSEMVLNINNKSISALVRYVRKEESIEGYKTSFAFTKILDSDRDFLSQVCIKKQLEYKRNSIV